MALVAGDSLPLPCFPPPPPLVVAGERRCHPLRSAEQRRDEDSSISVSTELQVSVKDVAVLQVFVRLCALVFAVRTSVEVGSSIRSVVCVCVWERGASVVFYFLHSSLSLHRLSSSVLSVLNQGPESNFFPGNGLGLNHPSMHCVSAGFPRWR